MPRGRQLALIVAAHLFVICAPAAQGQETGAADAATRRATFCAQRPAAAPLDGDASLHRSYVRHDSAGALPCGRDAAAWMPVALRTGTREGAPDARGSGGAPNTIGGLLQFRAGFEMRLGALQVRVAPELTSASNGDFQIFPGRDASRSAFASPFYHGQHSADLPLRPGDQALFRLDLGETGVWVIQPDWALALTTGLVDWGPGAGEGIVIGRSTAGVPRLEFSTWRPAMGGLLRARWFGGAVSEGRFFDADETNDLRSIAGLRFTYERERYSLGLSRTVMDGRGGGQLSATLLPALPTRSDSIIEFLAMDFLYRDAQTGTLAWLEGARQQPLRSFRDLALMPTEGLAIRVGLSQRILKTEKAEWIGGFEAVRLDQPGQREGRAAQDLYTSPYVAQGWTHRGQSLGSGLGPGGQRQYGSLDREGPVWRLGGFIERIRVNDGAMYREFLPYPNRHDVTLQVGARAARVWRGWEWSTTASVGRRLNYLFQNADFIPGYITTDLTVGHLALTLSPAR